MSKSRFEDLTYDERAEYALRIKTLRRDRGLTQDDLGAEAGVSRATINNWENGSTVPQADKLEVVFRALGVQIDGSQFEPATQEWLTIMGVLVEQIPAAERQPIMNGAISLIAAARGNVGDTYEHQELPTLESRRAKKLREMPAAAKRGTPAANRSADPGE